MSYNVEGKECQYCHAKLFSDDDVVICPDCGAPYHRDCYASLGHCALEQFHGTDESYEKKEERAEESRRETEFESDASGVKAELSVKCQMCGEEYSKSASSCPKCGAPNIAKISGQAIFFDFLGGVAPDYDLGDGVTADEAKKFVMANTNKYIPKFAKMKKGRKVFFNFLALLFPFPWLMSRKMYKVGAFIGTIEVALMTILYPYTVKMQNAIPDTLTLANSNKVWSTFLGELSKTHIAIFFSVFGAVCLLHILMGLFGDLLYKNHVISTLKDIKADAENFEDNLHKKGGISLLMLLVGFLISNNLPVLIASLAGVQ